MERALIKSLGHFFLPESHFDGLCAFLRKAAADERFDYKVAMARRCFNLCEAVHKMDGEKGDCFKNVISNQGILLYAKDFALHYLKHGFFPSLLVIDDILLYGRAISNALNTLEVLIVQKLAKLSDEPVDRYKIHLLLMLATRIRVYARTKKSFTVENAFLRHVESIVQVEGYELDQLSSRISWFLTECGVANTSFHLSIFTEDQSQDLAQADSSYWTHMPWEYKEMESHIWFYNRVSEFSASMQQAVFQYYTHEGLGLLNHKTWTGLVFMERTSKWNIDQLWDQILHYCKIEKDDKLKDMITWEANYAYEYKAQLLSLLMSAATLRRFMDEKNDRLDWSDVLDNCTDYRKLIRNFGYEKDVKTSIWRLLSNTYIFPFLSQTADDMISRDQGFRFAYRQDKGQEYMNNLAEDRMSVVGLQSDKEAYQYSRNLKKFVPLRNKDSILRLRDFRTELGERYGMSRRECLAASMGMIRTGVVSLQFDMEGELVFGDLKAGELSTHTLPERYKDILQALILTEKQSWMMDLSPQKAVLGFIDYLSSHLNLVPEKDVNLVRSLKESFVDYVKLTYEAGRTLARWEKVSWFNREIITREGKDFQDRMDERRRNRAIYRRLAEKYTLGLAR